MIALPAVNPLTVPDTIPTVATAVIELDQKPPSGVLLNVVNAPTQMLVEPVMGPGFGLTVTTAVA